MRQSQRIGNDDQVNQEICMQNKSDIQDQTQFATQHQRSTSEAYRKAKRFSTKRRQASIPSSPKKTK